MFRSLRPLLLAVMALVLLAAACGGDDSSGEAAADTTAATDDTAAEGTDYAAVAADAEWEEHVPGGDCQCADGSEFSFWSREGDPEKVVLFFQGGGACFTAEMCSFTDGTYTVQADGSQVTSGSAGVFDAVNEANPFRDYSFVFVPYCTGDIHLGDAVHDYGDGLTVNHVGYVNASAGLDYVVENFPDASEVFVTGSSAGGVPSPMFAGLASDALPDADIASLSDASGAYPSSPAINAAIGSLWGTFANVPDWPENEGLTPEDWGVPTLFVQAGLHDPDIRFARYDAAYDEVQQEFSDAAGFAGDDLKTTIEDNEAQIEADGVPVASYISPGTVHTILGDNAMYDLEVEGVPFIDWLTDFVAGDGVGDVVCVDCQNPADA
ncbi:MAG TPA: pectin acetylesterase-family hydrolase [Acidimicrobiales bacterium]